MKHQAALVLVHVLRSWAREVILQDDCTTHELQLGGRREAVFFAEELDTDPFFEPHGVLLLEPRGQFPQRLLRAGPTQIHGLFHREQPPVLPVKGAPVETVETAGGYGGSLLLRQGSIGDAWQAPQTQFAPQALMLCGLPALLVDGTQSEQFIRAKRLEERLRASTANKSEGFVPGALADALACLCCKCASRIGHVMPGKRRCRNRRWGINVVLRDANDGSTD